MRYLIMLVGYIAATNGLSPYPVMLGFTLFLPFYINQQQQRP
jgi:hypothetical protein